MSYPSTGATALPRTTTLDRARPYVEATLFVAVWMALGVFTSRDANLYLLLGVPLTAAFQLLRRRPLRALWLREAPAFSLDAKGWLLAAALAVAPAVYGVQAVLTREWVPAAWMLCALAGAAPAAYALRRFGRAEGGLWLRWIALPAVIGAVLLGLALIPAATFRPGPMLVAAAEALLLYVPVQFLLEEVSFRGLLDSHVARPGTRGWVSAVFVSALWGLWHLPIVPAGTPLVAAAAQALLLHVAVGVPLSFGWRRTGNLAVPVLAHALLDAFRNALLV